MTNPARLIAMLTTTAASATLLFLVPATFAPAATDPACTTSSPHDDRNNPQPSRTGPTRPPSSQRPTPTPEHPGTVPERTPASAHTRSLPLNPGSTARKTTDTPAPIDESTDNESTDNESTDNESTDDESTDDESTDSEATDDDRSDHDRSDDDRSDDDRSDDDRSDDDRSDDDRGDDDRGDDDRGDNTPSDPGPDSDSDSDAERSAGSTTAPKTTDSGSSASSDGHPSPPSSPKSRNRQDPGCANPLGQQPTDRRSGTPETAPPPATPPTRPGDVVDLRNWYLTLPTGAAGDPDTVHQPDLATYNSPHFALNDARDGVVFTAPVDGTTTKNSRYARSELREMNGAEEAAWSNTNGVHTLVVTQAVTRLPEAKPEAVTAQIHDGGDDVVQIRLEGQRLLAQYDDGNQQVDLDPHYTLGTRYTITLTAAEGRVQVRYNDQPPVELPLSGTGWYFKAGAYVQSSTTTGDRPPASAQVVIYSLTTTHNDNNDTGLPTTSSDRPTPSPSTTPATPTPDPDPTQDDAAGDQTAGDKPAGDHPDGGNADDSNTGGADAGAPGVRPVTSRCTHTSSGSEVPAAQPGETVCFTGELPDRLVIEQGGTSGSPVTYSGNSQAVVPGITVRADHIVIEGFVVAGADSTGIWASGTDIVIRDNDISAVHRAGDDVDAIRFFGDHITLAHNWAHDVWANPDAGGKPHVDCMQTFAHSEPASSHIRIEANKCDSPDLRQCLMAEGPHDVEDGASGIGTSTDWLVTGNYFACHAPAQTVALQDIHNVTFTKNTFAGTGNKAIALQRDATGATVTDDNIKGPGYQQLVGIDHETARTGYNGPQPQ